jgi:hypothetical protein
MSRSRAFNTSALSNPLFFNLNRRLFWSRRGRMVSVEQAEFAR